MKYQYCDFASLVELYFSGLHDKIKTIVNVRNKKEKRRIL